RRDVSDDLVHDWVDPEVPQHRREVAGIQIAVARLTRMVFLEDLRDVHSVQVLEGADRVSDPLDECVHRFLAHPSPGRDGFTDEERAAMKEYLQEKKVSAGRGPRADKADGESAVLAKIAEMREPDRAMGKRLHAIIKASAPALSPRTWYGMPAYAKDGEVVCFFQPAQKFKTRYATFGFSDAANLDEGAMWPVAFALKELTPTEEARISALVKKAVS